MNRIFASGGAIGLCLALLLSFAPCSSQDLELVQEIGMVEGSAEYTFFRIADLALGPDGEILVLDGGGRSVSVYDSAGRFVRRFGREGGGPGEFLEPVRVRVDSRGIHVFDWRNARLTRFDMEGAVERTVPYPRVAGLGLSRLYAMADGSVVGVSLFRASLGSEHHDPHVRVVRLEGEQADTLLTMERGTVLWHGPGGMPWGLAPSSLGYTGAVAVAGDSAVALVDATSSSLEILRFTENGMRSAGTLSVPLEARRVDDSTLDRVEEEVREEFSSVPSRLELIAPSAVSDLTGRAFFDDRGRVWVETRTNDEGGRRGWLVVSVPDGATRFVTVPDPFELVLVSGGHGYGVWRNEWDVETVRVYRFD